MSSSPHIVLSNRDFAKHYYAGAERVCSTLPIQHLQYLPFGENHVSEHTASPYRERFTFTGKERDEETGYGYFGARYMDHELMTMWLSVDPLSDKYPSMSPYNYCAWNPVKLVDEDGREAIEICPWYRSSTGEMYYSTDNVSVKTFCGKKCKNVGLTATYGNTYYSLMGDKADKNSINGQITQNIDNALIKHAAFLQKYRKNEEAKSEARKDGISEASIQMKYNDPVCEKTDFSCDRLKFDKKFASNNEHYPNECGNYFSSNAAIYYTIRGSNMEGSFNGFTGTEIVKGANGHSWPKGTWLTFGNGGGVICGIRFNNQFCKDKFINKYKTIFGL